jgi:hypothetical protein
MLYVEGYFFGFYNRKLLKYCTAGWGALGIWGVGHYSLSVALRIHCTKTYEVY